MKNLRCNNMCLRALALLCLLMTSVGAWAADYVLTYTTGGTTYYLARNGTTGVTRVNTFDPTTCIWSCENAAGTASTIGNNTTYGWLYQTVDGTKYYLKHGGTVGLTTTKATGTGNNSRNTTCWRTNGTYVYNYYRTNTTTTYFITLNGDPGSRTSANGNCAIPYQVTYPSVVANYDGVNPPTITCGALSGSAGIQLNRTDISGTYIPQHNTYTANGNVIGYNYNNTFYANIDAFKVTVKGNDATYNWSVTAGTANVSTTGVVTLGNNNTQNVTVRCRATINGVNKDATYTLNATATAALNETAYSDITITPSSQTLDLGEEVTYTVSPSISQVTKTRPQYVTVTDAQGHTHYKVGATYQAAEPTITETPGAAINFTSFSWSAAEGGAYFTLDPYYSASSNKVTLTRSAQKTGTQQTFTISVTGVYGGQNKTASAIVTIPATKVDLTALHAGEAINLGMGSSEGISSHYTYEPDYDAAGSPYLKFKYTSNSESVATVDASGKVTAVGPGSTTITVTAVKLDGTDGVTCNVTVNVTIDAPTISIDGSGNVTITHPVPGVQIRYTTNGTNPTATTGTVYSGTFAASNEQTIKAIAVANGVASAVVSEFYATSGVSGTKVVINDYEDHNWTYYAGVDSEVDGGHYNTTYRAQGTTRPKYDAKIYSPNPRNVKITYNATNNAAVSLAESENSFVYYKTLEQGTTEGQYPYQVISNPFSKRPAHSGTTYYGFAGWKIVSGGQYINGYNDGQTLPLDAEITFVNLPYPSVNCTSAEIVFETTWTTANRTYISTNPGSNQTYTFNSGTYETNFIVINVNYTRQITISGSATIMMVEPDGSADYRARAYSGALVPATGAANTTKIEFANWTATGTRDAYGRNLTIGRGMIMSTARDVVGSAQTGACNQVLKIESGNYGTFYHFTATPSSLTKQWITFGNDYDRAKKDWEGNNNTLNFSGQMRGAASRNVGKGSTEEMWRVVAKSGKYLTGVGGPQDAAAEQSYYIGVSGTHNNGHRYLEIQGGHWAGNISGGMGEDHTPAEPAFTFRMRGGRIVGSIYGAAQYAGAGGGRTYILTGGEINGWVAAGANGTQSSGGLNDGASYVYVGGNAVVDSKHSATLINRSVGGNVYGAGCGYSGTSNSGEMTLGSNMVVADNAYIERGLYGGGAYGFVTNTQTSYIYITGGHVGGYTGQDYGSTTIQGGVYGGARQNKGGSAIIYMTGGLVETGIYGGSNNSGTMNGSVTMQINGGQVGTSTTTPGNIHGGGYGQNTVINQNVDITLGKTGVARDADGVTVWGDVYGGSALGSVNGTAASDTKHTNVTMNAGYIHGSLYGGALGNAGTAANVYGPVQVKVYGGSVMNTDGTGSNGSGAVYGANNINGAPQRSVTVDIYGTNSAPAEGEYALFAVYGGGNQANYTYGNGYPKVTVHNCDNSIEYVYGGGNAAAVAATDVTIYGGNKIGNVFGGGNGQVRAANVNGNTNVKIYGGTIGDVYGGSNTNGTIGGTISVNVNAQAEGGSAACPVNIDNVYGGGNQAASNAGSITIGCAEHIGTVYGGANQANITGDITLNINSGHIDNVFGGNNTSGAISGNITVNVNDNGSACGMEVGNVYGGGNQAAYGHNTDYPQVNILNGTITGSVFGGGLGSTAIVTGNPKVNINAAAGKTISVGGSVFGGGSLAPIVGNTDVKIIGNSTVQGNVYGGGNQAEVSGTTKVQVGECD